MRKLLVWGIPIAAVISVGVGVALLVQARTASFGWFAYAPLSDAIFSPSVNLVPGLTFLIGGLVVLAGFGGYLLGRHRRA